MGITTLISSIFIVASLVWATYNFVIVQSGAVRQYDPHYEYDEIPYWPYNNDFAGGRTNWFEHTNYTDVLLNPPLPDDILDHLDEVIFTVGPADPPQLWRVGAYDDYDGSNWGKTNIGTYPLDYDDPQLITYGEATNQIYTVAFNATAGATVGAMELPTLFPEIRVIEDSFLTWSIDSEGNPYPDPGRLLDYDLDTDEYGTLLFTPFIQGTTGEEVIVTFDLTFETQDIGNVVANAQPGPGTSQGNYLGYPILTPAVEANISQFDTVGSNAYEKAMAVQLYFQSTFELLIDSASLGERPGTQEVTDWFLERGGGLPQDFATAYCVFMRRLGVQSRFAMGYALGEPDSTNSYRTLQVRHMTFWAEVFIPMSGGGGEWIQVIPAMLPDDMGGGEDPTNTPIPNIELLVWPTNGQPWEQIGTPFELSAAIFIEGVPVTTPELIVFNDETDGVYIGSQTIPSGNPIANVTHTFPTDATVDYHIIAASWTTSTFSITNRTSIYAVGTPDPYSDSLAPATGEFVLSETTELNVSQGLDTHLAYWEDTVHVYGTMTVAGVPVNSSNHDNRNIGIYWDDTFMGNATIDEYGYYELDIYVDPMNHVLMTVGRHRVWSWYLGDWDEYGTPRLFPAQSDPKSNITIWGRVGFDLYVSPTAVSAGATIDYDGVAYLLNGTLLPAGQPVGVFFSTQDNTTQFLNATGGFSWSYPIPITQPDGSYFAYANWTSPWPLIKGNWSYSIEIIVGSSGTDLSINPLPDPVYVSQNITISGYLTHASNGSGIGGRWVEIYWNNGSDFLIGIALTAPDGFYFLNYTALESDEGPIEYWSVFAGEPLLAPSESDHLFTNVKKIDVSLDPIFVTPDPVHVLQPIDIQGNLTFPESPGFLFSNEWVDFWLQNSTGVYYIGSDLTNATGGYFYQYTIPISQSIETVYIWANYSSPYYTVYDGESLHEPLSVEATGTLISIQEDFTFYYVNETIFLYGNLQFSNGTPMQDEIVYIEWVNASGTFVFPKTTDAFGNYFMFYNCTPTQDDPGLIDVYVNWTSPEPSFIDHAFSSVAPQIQLERYDLEITLDVPSQVFVDQLTVWFDGILSYLGGFPTLPGETLTIYWDNGTHLLPIDLPVTNSTGGFKSSVNFTQYTLGDYDFWANYQSPDLLHNDAWQYFQITRLNYTINVDIIVNPNPVIQNGSITVDVTLTFSHNGTALSDAEVLILWYNGTWYGLGFITTDGTGQGNLSYSGMAYDDIRSGIEIYGYYAGSQFTDANVSFPVFLTLNQWQTTLVNIVLPVGPYRIGETVTATGNLEYVIPSVPYGGVTVELTLFGITRTTDVTASDGSFTLNWIVPGTLTPGSYDVFVEFNSPYPWIASTSTINLPIDVIAPEPQFTEFSVTPSTVYLDQSLTIYGRVVWDNGTPYSNLPLDVYWGDYYSTANNVIVPDYLTDGSGYFTIIFEIPDDLDLLTYVQHVWAYIDPAGYATFGESPIVPITVDIYHVSLTTAVDLTTVYLGGTVTFSGTLQFTNTTPLVGYDVEIYWGGVYLTTITISDPILGAFSYPHPVPYSNAIGDLSGYALFRAPTIAWGDLDTLEFFDTVTVIELVDVFMDPEPAVNIVSRGDTLVIEGDVFNDGGFAADGVTVEALADSGGTGSVSVTAGDGSFSISLVVPTNANRGVYNISVHVTSLFHQLRFGPTEWFIQVYIDTRILVDTNPGSFMPGERISVYIELFDDDFNPLDDEMVSVYLGLTQIADVQMTTASGMSFDLVIPLSWSEGNGHFNITAEYDGNIALYINRGSVESAGSIHVFDEVVFTSNPRRVDPGQSFIIECYLRDPEGNPITYRSVWLNINTTDTVPYFIDDDGSVFHSMPALVDGTVVNFRIILISTDIDNIRSDIFTINIQTTGGNPLQGTDLLIASILLIGAVVAVLAYLYIVRGMFRSPTISRGFDIPTKLRNIKKLADSGKYGASITLAYRTFEQMCGTKMGSERTHSETAREFLDRVLEAIPLDSGTVEQFVQTYEEARFSHHEMTRERYEEAVRIFTDLYPRIDSTAPVE
jgi:hypothetical protein